MARARRRSIIAREAAVLDRDALFEDIRALIDAPLEGGSAPFLDQFERTLTDGYALALAIEIERTQLQRQLGEVADQLAEGEPDGPLGELSALARRLKEADGDLEELRVALASLRERASRFRAA